MTTPPSVAAIDKPAKTDRRYGGLTAAERSEQRKQKLISSAIEVFGTLGLRKATIRDICSEARLPERHFSEHFGGISDAYEAAFKLISRQALEATSLAMSAAPMNTHDLAVAGTRAFFQFVKDDPRRAQILLLDSLSYWHNVTVKTNKELTAHAQAMGQFAKVLYPHLPPTIRLEIVSEALIGMTIQVCLAWAQRQFKQPVEEVTEHLMFAWDGLDRWLNDCSNPPPPAAKPPVGALISTRSKRNPGTA